MDELNIFQFLSALLSLIGFFFFRGGGGGA